MKLISLICLFFLNSAFSLEDPLKIAIIDTGLNLTDPRFQDHICSSGHKDFTGTGIKDVNGHGTFVAGLIQEAASLGNYCFLIYKFYSARNSGQQNLENEILAIKEAIKNGSKVVNISGGGSVFSESEYFAIRSSPGVRFVVAAGNEHENIDIPSQKYYPASYSLSNITVVGAIDEDGFKLPSSNWGKKVNMWELGDNVMSTLPEGKRGFMTGTSMATGSCTGKLIRKILKTHDREEQ